MTETGVAHTGADGAACTHVIRPKKDGDGRLVEIRAAVREYVRGSELVIIEGYLNKSMSAGITGMVHGAVRSLLLEEGIPYATLPPSSLKKYATGSGGSATDKTAMIMAAYKRGGIEFRNHNECDAWWLWVAARDHLDAPWFPLPSLHRESLMKIKMEG